MADFNLSAEIALQLAQNSIAGLKKDIQKAFSNIAADIDADDALTKAQKAAYKKTIIIPAVLDFKQANAGVEDIEKKLKPVKIKVELDKTFLKKNFSPKAFQEYVDNLALKPTLKIGVEFDKDAQKALNKLSLLKKAEAVVQRDALKQQNAEKERARKKAEKDERAAAIKRTKEAELKFDLGGFDDLGAQLGKQAKGIRDFIDLIEILSEESDQLNKSMKGAAAQATFFQNASKGVKDILTSLGEGNEKAGIVNLTNRFQGLDGQAKNNLVSAVKIMFRAVSDIESQEERLRRALLAVGKSSDIAAKELGQLSYAKQAIVDLFNTFDAVDPSVFATRIKSATRDATESTGNLVRNLTTDLSRYTDLINSLEGFKARTQFGGSNQAKDVVQNQIDLVKQLRGKDKSVRDIKADDQFQINNATLKALGFVDITFGRIENTFSSLKRKANGDLATSVFGDLSGIGPKVNGIITKALDDLKTLRGQLSGQDAIKVSQDTRNKAVEEINKEINRVEVLNKKYLALQSIQDTYSAAGFTQSAAAVGDLRKQLEGAATSGKTLDQVAREVDASLAKIQVDKSIENTVNKTIRQLERMKTTFGRESEGDFTGILDQFDKLEAKIKTAFANKATPLTAGGLDTMTTKGIFDIRQGEKINKYIENTAHKLRLLGDAQDDLAVEAKYDLWATKFEKSAQKIIATGGSTVNMMNKLKKASDDTFVKARFDADGGFFGTVSKAAGLAAKRLGAFLILAQGLYGIQEQITESISDAVTIDKEFVKLEQVITGGLSGPALDTAYKDLEALKQQILSLGSSFGVATTEIASSAQVLAQAGLAGKELKTILDVVTKSQLGPSFASANETSEASIAIMQQFNLTANQTADALGGVNRLSAKYAVEAQGITEAVRRAGGVFASSGGNIAEFATAFTIVKEQTREADESIATALRNITQRIQRSSVQKYLKETLNIDLIDAEGKFIGFEKSITAIGEAIKKAGISENSPLFSAIREKLAGTLQAGRITPLLQNYSELIEKADEFRAGAKSIDEDVVKAFNSIENKIQRAKSAVVELFSELGQNEFIKALVEGFTQITIALTNMLKALNTLPGAVLAFGAAFKGLGTAKGVLQSIFSQFNPRAFNFAGGTLSRNTGGGTKNSGQIPGRGPNVDSILAYLTKGEYVIQRPIVDKFGVNFFDKINQGILPSNTGGIVSRNSGGVIPGIPRFNTGGLLDKLLAGGFNLTQSILSKHVKNFKVEDFAGNPAVRGSASVKKKSIQLSSGAGLDTLAHEFGHIITAQLDQSELLQTLSKLPAEFRKQTIDRMKTAPGSYGKEGSAKFNSKVEREIAADAVKQLAARASGSKAYPGDPAFEALQNQIKRQTGIGFFKSNDRVVRPLSEPNDIINTGTAPAPGRRPLTEPGPPTTDGQGRTITRNNSYRTVTEPSDRAPKGQAMTPRGGRNVSVGSNRLFNPIDGNRVPAPAGPRGMVTYSKGSNTKFDGNFQGPPRPAYGPERGTLGQRLSGVMRRNPLSNASATSKSLFPTLPSGFGKLSKSLSGVNLSAIATKGGLVALVGGLLALQSTVTGVNAELGNLIAAMAAGAATFSLASKAGSISLGASDKVGEALGIGAKFGSKAKQGIINRVTKASGGGKITGDALTLAKELTAAKGLKNLKPSSVVGKSADFAKDSANFKLLSNPKASIDLIKSQGAAKTASTAATSAKSLAAFGGKLNIAAIAVGIVTGALTYFSDSVENAGNAALANAANQEEAIAASDSARRAKTAGKVVKGLGGIATGAFTGAALGGPIGAIVGAIGGALLTFQPKILKSVLNKLSPLTGLISDIFGGISNVVSSTFAYLGDKIYVLMEGQQALLDEQAAAALSGRQNFTKNRLQRVAAKNGTQNNELNLAEVGDILATTQISKGVIDRAGGVDKLDPEQNTKIKDDLQKVSEIYTALPETERAKILDAAKRSGVDLKELFANMDVDLIDAKVEAAAAFESLSGFLAAMKQTVDLTSARLSGFEAGMAQITDRSQQSFVPDQVFDILGKGFDPKALGFDQFESQIAKLGDQVRSFDPNLDKAVGNQLRGQKAVRGLQGAVTSDAIKGINFKTEGNKEAALKEVLSGAFDAASGGNEDLNAQFDNFIGSKIDQLGDVFGNNDVLGSKVNEMLDEFANSLDQGALDQVKRLNDINKQYYSSYLSLMQERFAKEKEITDLTIANADKDKTRYDYQNKAKGLTGDKLANVQKLQAAAIDGKKQSAILQGTGYTSGDPAALGQALVQSQIRARGFESSGNAEALAKEQELQSKLTESLKYGASGGETAAFAMQEFDRAAQKAAASSKFLTDTLLGTDDQIIDTYKGIAAFQSIRAAGSQQEAQALVATMSESQRTALNSYLGQNQEASTMVQDKLGFGPTIANGPEAGAVDESLKKQQEYNAALASGFKDQVGALNTSSEDLKKFYKAQFDNAMTVVNAANESAKNLVNQIASLPNVISHEGKIEVNLIGAGDLKGLQEGLKGFIDQQINHAFLNLQKENQGMNVPAPVKSSARAAGGLLGAAAGAADLMGF